MEVKILFLALLLMEYSHIANCDDDSSEEESIKHHLDDSVIPLHYDLEFTPYLMVKELPGKDQFTFDGEASIQIKATKSNIKKFELHNGNLTITKAEIKSTNRRSESSPVEFSEPDSETDKFTVTLRKPMIRGMKYVLSFEFSGEMTNKTGFLNYLNPNDKKTWLLKTNFHPSGARKAFPCFDEPKFKATFQIKVNRHKKYTAYSNTQIQETTNLKHNRAFDVFKTTAKMSIHNIALHLTNIEAYNKPEYGNITFIVDSQHRANIDEFLYPIISKIFAAFDSYTDFPHNSIPNFENLNVFRLESGVGSYSTFGLLNLWPYFFHPVANSQQREILTGYLASEIGKIWFGNVVNCELWTYEMLDITLANYVKNHACEMVEENWNTDKTLSKSLEDAFNAEDQMLSGFTTLSSSSMLMMGELEEYPDRKADLELEIAYYRNPAVVGMVENTIGYDGFREAIRQYIKNNAYDTVTPDDFWTSLKSQWHNSEVDFEAFFKSWTETVGYPLVEFTLAKDGKSFLVTQKQYFPYVTDSKGKEWIIPITYTTSNEKYFKNKIPDFYLTNRIPVTIKLDKPAEWIVGNLQRSGYYRVNYDPETWKRIGKALRQKDFGGFDEISRSQILNDLYYFGVSGGTLDIRIILYVSEYARYETSNDNWRSYIDQMQSAAELLNKKQRVAFGKYMQYLMSPKIDQMKTGYLENEEGNLDKIIANLCYYGDKKCLTEATDLVDSYLDGKSKEIDGKMIFAFSVVVYHHSDKFDKIFEIMKEKKPKSLYRISCPADEGKLDTFLNYFLDNLEINNNVKQIINVLLVSCTQKSLTFDFFTKNFDKIFENADAELVKTALFDMAIAIYEENKIDLLIECLDKAKEKFNLDQDSYDNFIKIGQHNLNMFGGKEFSAFLEENYGQKSSNNINEDDSNEQKKSLLDFSKAKSISLSENILFSKNIVINY